ncbi:MAG: hypothetical protein ACE5FJ_10255 [Gemmatimonadales bacterium]
MLWGSGTGIGVFLLPGMRLGKVRMNRAGTLTSARVICVWIPLFPLRCEESRHPSLRHRPTALLSNTDSRRVWQASPRARHCGVRAGMIISQAIGLCPALSLFEPDPVYYDEAFSGVMLDLERISPVVEPSELGRAYVGVDGLDRLIGGPEQQLRKINVALQHYSFATSLRLGWGVGKFIAWVAAMNSQPGTPTIIAGRDTDAFLKRQSVACLPINTGTYRRLLQLGIKSLRDLAHIPQPAIISQFGNEGREAWLRATNRMFEPVEGKPRPEPIVAKIDFNTPVADHQLLVHSLSRLTERALRHPQRIGWRVHTLRVRGTLEFGKSWSLSFTLKKPSANREQILGAIRFRLEQLPPSGAVESLQLEFIDFAPGTAELQLFARDAASSARTGRRKALRWAVKQMKVRFRRSLLYHVVEVDPWSRIPERRYALIDYDP